MPFRVTAALDGRLIGIYENADELRLLSRRINLNVDAGMAAETITAQEIDATGANVGSPFNIIESG